MSLLFTQRRRAAARLAPRALVGRVRLGWRSTDNDREPHRIVDARLFFVEPVLMTAAPLLLKLSRSQPAAPHEA
jgi:DNA segregation ATPase FtsK/SpoIIIE-like protein